MTYTPIFAAFYMLLIFLLGANVSWLRLSLRISMGEGDNKIMRNAIRAHANALEHMIPFLVVLYFFEVKGGSKVWLLSLGIGFGISRLFHAMGLLLRSHKLRQIGATLTLVGEFLVVALLLWKLFF